MTAALSDFAKTGFFARIRSDAKITRFQVVGERSSGTNYASRLIGKNSALSPDTPLGWKHGFIEFENLPDDVLVVAMVRHAGVWSRSMHKRPWHSSDALQALELSDFLRAPWDTSFDEAKYFRREEKLGLIGGPLTYDRHPDTGEMFENVYTLRRAKLTALLAGAKTECNFILLRMEPMIKAPEDTLRRVLDAANVPLNAEGFRGIFKRLGSKFHPRVDPRPKTPNRLSDEDRAFMRSQLDIEQEAQLGYRY